MKEVVIEYPFMRFKRRAVGQSPSSWSELTQKQFVAVSRIIGGENPDYHFLSQLTGINKDILRKLAPYELLKLSEQINFFTQERGSHSEFIIPYITGSGPRLYAPRPKLSGITFGQFIFMDSYYSDFCLSMEETDLNKFVAALYLPLGRKFSKDLIPTYAKAIVGSDIYTRSAIALNYSLITLWLQKAYPLIFSEPFPQEVSPLKEPSASNSAWINIFESMVGDDLINRDRYAELPIHTVLRTLTKKYKENARR
jgi:hypothetical protein